MSRKIDKGQVLSIRLPVDTPIGVIRQLNEWKERGELVTQIVSHAQQSWYSKEKRLQPVTIFVPDILSDDTKIWLDAPHTKELLGALVLQLTQNPAAPISSSPSLFACINQNEHKSPDEEAFKVETEFHNRLARSFFDDE